MKYTKMWTDGKPTQNPQNTTRINKNLVIADQIGSWVNEKGFTKLRTLGLKPIGIIPLDRNDFVVFSTNGTNNHEIGYFNNVYNYTVISNNVFWNFKLENPIHGEFYRNNQDEVVISWVDDINIPRTLNINNLPVPLNQHTVSTFTYTHEPKITSFLTENGNLPSGAYVPIVRYVGYDNSTTSWLKSYNPVYVVTSNEGNVYENYQGVKSGEITNKSINLTFSNVNNNYKYLEIGVIYIKDGVKFAYSVKNVLLNGLNNTNVTISDNNIFTAITLDEVVVDKVLYKKGTLITSFEDAIYLRNLEEYKQANLQVEVNKLQFKWVSELGIPVTINNSVFSNSDKYHKFNNQKRTFAHDEVYALYFRVGYYYGTSQWFHCAGRVGIPSEKVDTLTANNGNQGGYYKYYQLFDTCSGATTGINTAEGELSFWENENEQYPNTGYYPSGNVRHIKFPSLRWMKQNIWTASNYGCNAIDRLGIKITNINLNNFADCDGNIPLYYEIGYAKRGLTDTRIQGQSIGINAQYLVKSGDTDTNEYITSLGGNWKSVGGTSRIKENSLNNNLTNIRVYPFEALREQFALVSNFIRTEYTLATTDTIHNTNSTKHIFQDVEFAAPTIAYATSTIQDYTNAFVSNSVSINENVSIRAINNQRYILNNSLLENQDNIYLETAINVEIKGITVPLFTNVDNIYSKGFNINRTTEPLSEQTGLITLLNVKEDYYLDFVNKEIVITDTKGITNQVIWGGDSYLCDYSINTFGKYANIDYEFKAWPSDPLKSTFKFDDKWNGIKACHRFLCESKFNINLRHTEYGTEFEKSTTYYPNISSKNKYNFLNILERDVDPNNFQVGYNSDLHFQNIIEFDRIFDWKKEYDYVRPDRIITSGILNNEFNINQWKDWKANNYYDLPANKGRAINLEANKDFIYIHSEHELLRTIGRKQIQLNGDEVTIGTGNIFNNVPEAIIHDEFGYLGTQHKWSCISTPHGYTFFDSEKGIWWLIEGGNKPVPISADGMHNFFREQEFSTNDNPFTSYGIIAYYDEFYKRLIVTNKNKVLKSEFKSRFRGVWRANQYFINSLNAGDIVIKNGKYVTIG